jgi:aflatoxin B1 aldehyde reductase
MFIHAPDRTTPFAETMEAVDKEYRAGKFEEFGLSNFNATEVEECVEICRKNGYVVPTVYQGQYNAITRGAEKSLFPVLRKHGMRFHAFRYVEGRAVSFSMSIERERNRNVLDAHG